MPALKFLLYVRLPGHSEHQRHTRPCCLVFGMTALSQWAAGLIKNYRLRRQSPPQFSTNGDQVLRVETNPPETVGSHDVQMLSLKSGQPQCLWHYRFVRPKSHFSEAWRGPELKNDNRGMKGNRLFFHLRYWWPNRATRPNQSVISKPVRSCRLGINSSHYDLLSHSISCL